MLIKRYALALAASVASVIILGTPHAGVAISASVESQFRTDSADMLEDEHPLLAQGATYLTPLEQAVLEEMNFARQNPSAYADILEERRQYYNGPRFEMPGRTTILTVEGLAAVDEAIAYLRNATPQPPLISSYGMHLAAKDHVNDGGGTDSCKNLRLLELLTERGVQGQGSNQS